MMIMSGTQAWAILLPNWLGDALQQRTSCGSLQAGSTRVYMTLLSKEYARGTCYGCMVEVEVEEVWEGCPAVIYASNQPQIAHVKAQQGRLDPGPTDAIWHTDDSFSALRLHGGPVNERCLAGKQLLLCRQASGI